MTGLLVDTNVPSELTRSLPSPLIADWFHAQDDSTLHLSVITVGELRRGCTTHPDPVRRERLTAWLDGVLVPLFADRIHPVTQAVADRWGLIDGARRLAGRPLGVADGLIAATALEHQLTLVTRNVKDFEGLGLTLINPWDFKA